MNGNILFYYRLAPITASRELSGFFPQELAFKYVSETSNSKTLSKGRVKQLLVCCLQSNSSPFMSSVPECVHQLPQYFNT